MNPHRKALVAVAAGAGAIAARAAASGCAVTYTVSSQWQGGSGADVSVNNLGDPITGWQLTWSFGAGQTITQLWNGSYTQSGAQVAVTDAGYNGSIATGGTASFGFNGSWTGSNPQLLAQRRRLHRRRHLAAHKHLALAHAVRPAGLAAAHLPAAERHYHGVAKRPVRHGHGQPRTPLRHRATARQHRPSQFMPFGNGVLGVASWAANGFTAQLNRNDTMPNRLSPGQVVIPGLSKLTGASDFRGYLDLYDGMLHESGGGMTMTAYVRADAPELVVDVTGADPDSTQTAQVKLCSGRSLSAQASGSVAMLSQAWSDNSQIGALRADVRRDGGDQRRRPLLGLGRAHQGHIQRRVTAQHMSYNGSLAPGGSTTFGFLASWNNTNAVPAVGCALN